MSFRGLRWTSAPSGHLSPWQQSKALALREACQEIFAGTVKLTWICDRLTKVGGGKPATPSLWEFFKKVDNDADWFPGKHTGTKRGPHPQCTKAKRACIANALMAAKKHGGSL